MFTERMIIGESTGLDDIIEGNEITDSQSVILESQIENFMNHDFDVLAESIASMNPNTAFIACKQMDFEVAMLESSTMLSESAMGDKAKAKLNKTKNAIMALVEKVKLFLDRMYQKLRANAVKLISKGKAFDKKTPVLEEAYKKLDAGSFKEIKVNVNHWDIKEVRNNKIYDAIASATKSTNFKSFKDLTLPDVKKSLIKTVFKTKKFDTYLTDYSDAVKGEQITRMVSPKIVESTLDIAKDTSKMLKNESDAYTKAYNDLKKTLNDVKKAKLETKEEIDKAKLEISSIQTAMSIMSSVFVRRMHLINAMHTEMYLIASRSLGVKGSITSLNIK